MAGGRPRGDGRRKRRSEEAQKATRRPGHVPPIIDLEATIIEDAKPAADAEGPRSGPADAGKTGGEDVRPQGGPESWMDEMKTFLFGGVHVGRWRIPAAGSLMILAIFAGGLVAGRMLMPDAQSGDEIEAQAQRLQAVEKALEAATRSNNALAARFQVLEEKLDAAGENARTARASADAALSEVRALDASLQDLAADAGESDPTRMAELQKQLGDLAARIEEMTESYAQGAGAEATAALESRIETLATALAGLKTSVEALASRASQSVPDAASAEALIEAARERLLESVDDIVKRVEDRLAALEDKTAESAEYKPSPAPVAAAALQRAVDAGSSFQRELAALAVAMPGDPAITAIAAHAERGIATRNDLAGRFEDLAAKLTAAQGSEAGDAEAEPGLVDDLWARVNRLVDIREQNAPGSRALSAAVATARAHIEEGDLAKAADALEGAGDGLGEDAATWIADARARVAVDAAMDGLLRRAVQSAAKPASGS